MICVFWGRVAVVVRSGTVEAAPTPRCGPWRPPHQKSLMFHPQATASRDAPLLFYYRSLLRPGYIPHIFLFLFRCNDELPKLSFQLSNLEGVKRCPPICITRGRLFCGLLEIFPISTDSAPYSRMYERTLIVSQRRRQ